MVTSEYVVFNINDFEGKRLAEHEIDIVKRFSRVFNQAYIRFLDLQKSEAQAREAQIEAALERVRSRTMAMQKSDELLEAGALLYKELNKLGINNLTTGYVLFNEDAKTGYSYGVNPADGSIRQHPVEMPHDETSIMKSIVKSWKNEESSLVIELNEEETIKHQTFIAERSKNFPISAEQLLAISPDRLKIHIFNFKQGYLLIVGDKVLKKVEQNLVIRFAKAFQQTYTRFLDLQKAEAQARESKIEAALERVRSRSMAMHHTSELQDVINTVHQQFTQLDIEISGGVFIGINEEIKDTLKCWGSGGTADYIQQIEIPYMDVPIYTEIIEGIQKGPGFFTEQFTQDEKIDFLTRLFEIPPYNSTTKTHQKEVLSRKGGYTRSCAVSENSCIFIISHHGHIFSKETNTILKRFAKVFEQAYTRFLDLQKAEAQTREAKIETALEKVRSRSMAMHHSDELWEVAELLFEQINSLGIELWSCGFSIWYDDDSYFMGYNPGPDGKLGTPMPIPLTEDVFFTTIRDAKRQGEDFIVFESKGKSLEQTYSYMDKLPVVGDVMRGFVEAGFDLPKFQVTHCGFFSYGHLMFITLDHNPEAIHIFKRFTKAFDQTYTRFLDLQKAEAQTRTAQINLAVERVRAKALAMHKSEEIMEVVAKLKNEVMALDIPDVVAASIFLKEGEENVRMWDLSTLEKDNNGYQIPFDITFKLKKKDPNLYVKRVWENPEDYFLEVQETKDLKRIVAWLRENDKIEIAKEVEEFTKKTKLKRLYHAVKKLNNGKLAIDLLNPPSDEMETILTKMGAAFDLAYKRFEDLKKAEAQTREAQIEAALERVRSRSMAMHKSTEMQEVANAVYEQMKSLGLEIHVIGMSGEIKPATPYEVWVGGSTFTEPLLIPYTDSTKIQRQYNKAIAERPELYQGTFSGEVKKEYIDFLISETDIPKPLKKLMQESPAKTTSISFSKNSSIQIVRYTEVPYSKEDNSILIRFAKVFNQAYIRFLDLQKSEAQSREAQIEAALEKVRSRSLAMHNPQELQEVVAVVAEKLKELGVIFDAGGVILCTYFPDNKNVVHWIAVDDFSTSGRYFVPYFDNPIFSEAWDSKIRGDAYFSKEFSVEAKNDFFNQAFENSDYKQMPDDYKQFVLQADEHHLSAAWSKNSAIIIPSLTGAVPSDDDAEILKRFAKVFEQAYIRFMDLEKAEAQARKAQIEASLERVRAKAMSMQNSDELDEVLSVLCEQFDVLGIVPMSTHMTVFDFENNTFTFRETGKFGNRSFGEQTVALDAMDNWKETVEKWKADEATAINKLHFPKEQLPTVWEVFHESFASMPEGSRITPNDYPDGIYHTAGKHPFGYIGMNQIRPATEEEEQIVIKFANEFGMAYQRFLDLKKAEAQAREAQIETALEKVRSRTMAMQHSDELPEAANNLFLQVQALGIPAWSAGYCIWEDENKKSAWCNMSSEGEIQKGFSLPTKGEGYDFYKPLKKKQNFHVSECGGKALVKHYDFMKKLPIVGEILLEFSQKGIALPTFQIFHIVFFTHGYLMFITYEAVPNEWDIFKRFGKVFEQTYTRFLDLRKAEAQSDLIKKEKERLEVTLSELKATQSQLIQSEKMASLGELTAGIAHEIQNPLNFVNNFSEVSKELLDEMLEEIENGDMEEVKAIMDDVIQNLEKINHHGKRADGIVKGMLQHSRASGSQKEPTNINGLADEYLRLAYHGLRAKDKSFNATLETDYDDTIEKINVIPQDIGRVVLNLLTNAFYVVNEKKQSNQNGFEPTVKLSTKKNGNWVTISVKDNGNGIPQKVLDKIFQPFFTTKPTGQGTGLGLSMSYDIITKGHGGELKVNTKEREGTEFQIILPIKS
jgi:signal transduction histidine kinase